MKKWLLFGAGILTGIVLTIAISFIPSKKTTAEDAGFNYFDKPGDVMTFNSYKVFQALSEGFALVYAESDCTGVYLGATCLLYNETGKYFYDDEIVKVPEGKVVRQIGVYHYTTKAEIDKTVPIIQIMDK